MLFTVVTAVAISKIIKGSRVGGLVDDPVGGEVGGPVDGPVGGDVGGPVDGPGGGEVGTLQRNEACNVYLSGVYVVVVS